MLDSTIASKGLPEVPFAHSENNLTADGENDTPLKIQEKITRKYLTTFPYQIQQSVAKVCRKNWLLTIQPEWMNII